MDRFLDALRKIMHAAEIWGEFGKLLFVVAWGIPVVIGVTLFFCALPLIFLGFAFSSHPLIAVYLLAVFAVVSYLYWNGYFNQATEVRKGRRVLSEKNVLNRHANSIRPVSRMNRSKR
jgi:hypothetical protein